MHDGLKQRLIGAIVLLALAVIFVPVIFDRGQLKPVDHTSRIPEAPVITPVTVPEPKATIAVEPAPPVDDIFQPEEPAEKPEEASVVKPVVERPSLNQQGVPNAWTLQVASYRSAERALEMEKLLIEQGYTAYTRVIKSDQGEMTRLFVGPKLDKSRLLQEQKEIEEKFKVSTMVLRFEP